MLSFAGVMIIVIDPEQFSLTIGMIFLVLRGRLGFGANILMKRIDPMPAMRLQAWVGLFSIAPLMAMSFATETGQAEAVMSGSTGADLPVDSVSPCWRVSIFAHGSFYRLIKRMT